MTHLGDVDDDRTELLKKKKNTKIIKKIRSGIRFAVTKSN